MTDGWNDSAAAWLEGLGDTGDFAREFVLDAPMLARIKGRGFTNALDIGCGEGRFCRLLKARGIAAIGIDPTAASTPRRHCWKRRGRVTPAAITVSPGPRRCRSQMPPSIWC